MTVATGLNKAAGIRSIDRQLAEKIRWSILRRLHKQVGRLSSGFFDELDDFLFSCGQQGRLSDNGIYLSAMREFRTKQSLFEKIFLTSLIDHISSPSREAGSGNSGLKNLSAPASMAVFESVEVDLALRSMSRKASKFYSPFIKQIESLQSKIRVGDGILIVDGSSILDGVFLAFSEAQLSFSIDLDVRLISMKLFEQQLVLRLEKVYLDIISILGNVDKPEFVDKLYSSSSAFGQRQHLVDASTQINSQVSTAKEPASTESAVEQLLAQACADKKLPLFIEKMIRTKWREVMLLIGQNRGCDSIEWAEAKHSLALLLSYVRGEQRLDLRAMDKLLEQWRQGLALIQLCPPEREELLLKLQSYLLNQHGEVFAADSSISPSGSRILNPDDLVELSILLDQGKSRQETDRLQSPISQYLARVEELSCPCTIDFQLGDQHVECELSKGFEEPASYQIKSQKRGFSISRSKLGLAICLRDGEVRLENN